MAAGNQTPICRCVIMLTWQYNRRRHCRRLPSQMTTQTKGTYRGLQGPVLDATPLGQLGIEGINNITLPLTVLAAVAFTSDLTPDGTNPDGYQSRAHLWNSAPILPKAVVIGYGGVLHSGTGRHFQIHVSPNTIREHWNAPARTVLQPSQGSNELVQDPEYGSWFKYLNHRQSFGIHLGAPASWSQKIPRHGKISY